MRLVAIAGLAAAALGANAARADDFIVYSPHVQATQSEIELRGYQYGDPRADFHGGSAAELSLAHAFNAWWKAELYVARYQDEPGAGTHRLGYEFENTFQLTPAGEYWADFGFLASYERNTRPHQPDAAEFGPLIEKTAGRFTHTLNLIWEKQLGAGAAGKYEFRYSYQGTYTLSSAFRAGIEAYGRPTDRAYEAGPVIAGDWHLPGTTSELEYRFGVVLGLNAAAPRRTWLAQLEYEFF
ncbi:MAG: hypothetical protein KGK06_08950 [Xanthomonadaceae bacterium]|nr:hypothetical protein [Xanthomonadaceae bacterium]MDE2278141.1 hypothetical protein [Xanthomonadaceae bacterium]MDE2316517.1 hypothetical protein [Xanthomonadaceae bacterium]